MIVGRRTNGEATAKAEKETKQTGIQGNKNKTAIWSTNRKALGVFREIDVFWINEASGTW